MPRNTFCVTFWLYPCSWGFGVSVGENVSYWSANTRAKVMEVRLEGKHSWYTGVRGLRQWGSAGRHQAITQRRGSRLDMGKLQETNTARTLTTNTINISFWYNQSAVQAATQQCYILYMSKYFECHEIVMNKPREATELYKSSPSGQNCWSCKTIEMFRCFRLQRNKSACFQLQVFTLNLYFLWLLLYHL